MSVSKGISSDKLERVLNTITEQKLLNYYFGITEIPCKINAPYRMDNNPSVGVYLTNNNKLRFKDFGTGDSGDIITLIQKTFGLTKEQTLDKILSDLDGPKDSPNLKVNDKTYKPVKRNKTVNIKVKTRDWRIDDIKFWESYGISLPWLKFGDVYPISRIFYEKEDGTIRDFPAEKYAYCYVEHKDGEVTLKIYQPYSKERKWISKHSSSVWDLWTKVPKTGDTLIITSSRKDALCIWENTGIPALSLQGEGYIPKKHVVEQLKSRFKEIYVLYDNDFQGKENYGRQDGQKLCELFGLKQIEIPVVYQSKDPSDLCKNHGRDTVRRVILNLIDESRNK